MTQDERINSYLLNLEQDGTIVNPIISAYRGSIAHNMYVPNTDPNSVDDIDLISICIPPIDYYFGLKEFGSRGTKEIKDDDLDIVVYELKKTIKMLINGNPNIMSLLWLRDEHYLKLDVAGEWLIKSRNLFSTKKVYDSFIGYANSQFSRMEKYSSQGYMGTKRKKLVDQFGFDAKCGSHLIRLITMCIEFMDTGILNVYREKDKQFLLNIKMGELTLEQVKTHAERLFVQAMESYSKTKLKDEPDLKAIEDLMINMISCKLNYSKRDSFEV